MAQEQVEVIVYVRGGVVQDVGCGSFVTVAVRDYDTDAREANADEGIHEDEDGEFYHESEW